jgi:hypothetical protein
VFVSVRASTSRAGALGLLTCCALLLGATSAPAAVVLEEGPDKVTTPKLELDFGDASGNVEFVQSLKWLSPKIGSFTADLASEGGGACGDPTEFWGQAYPNQDGTGPAPVVAGQRGSWEATSNRTVLIESVSAQNCSGNTPEIPVRTRYTFFEEGAAANVVRMERRISFAANQLPNHVVQGMRFYVPRLPAGTYNQEIYPNAAGTALNTIGSGGPVAHEDWNESWMAIDSSSTHAGLLIFHKPDGSHDASVTSDNDSSSGSNNSGITLNRPAAGWLEPATETEYLCFYDETTWPLLTRSPTNLPAGCATPEVPISVAPPTLSPGAGNPREGELFTAQPGAWEGATGSFAYQWFRCLDASCQEIAGADGPSHTATAADVGHSLKVRVTATAPGGETDFAETNVAGTVSGHVYEGDREANHLLGGARVQICRLKGSPCRSTTADLNGFYRLQAPTAGNFRVTAFPPSGSNAVGRTRTTITRVKPERESVNQDVVLSVPKPPPPSVQFTGPGVRATAAAGGVPVVHWQEPFEIDYETAVVNEVEAQIEFADGLVERRRPASVEPKSDEPEVGIFKFSFPPLFPNHGAARVSITVRAPRTAQEIQEAQEQVEEEEAEEEEQEEEEESEEEEPEEEEDQEEEEESEEEEGEEEQEEEETEENEEEEEGSGPEEIVFPLYIDPSGFVRTVGGAPLAGATVTLLQAPSASGPFTAVPDGSAVMSPMNRHNPDASEADGHFGWDVVAGFYKVRAQKGGCHAPGDVSQPVVETAVETIPPPVVDLDLRLDCPAPSGGGAGSPSPPTSPRRQGALGLRRATARVGATGKYVLPSVTATCPAGGPSCTLESRLTTKPAAKKRKHRPAKTVLASGVAAIAPGATAKVEGKISKAALRKLKTAGRLLASLSLTLKVPDGDGADGSVAVVLKPPKSRHR